MLRQVLLNKSNGPPWSTKRATGFLYFSSKEAIKAKTESGNGAVK